MKQSHAGQGGMDLPALPAKCLALLGAGSCRWRWLSPRGTSVGTAAMQGWGSTGCLCRLCHAGQVGCSGLAAQHVALVPAKGTRRVTFAPGPLG